MNRDWKDFWIGWIYALMFAFVLWLPVLYWLIFK